eukprot:TRINITY_DN15696_c0_g1_i1.p1 TRINITY_DN15696_c0_g1~~TRINITY_DN15696_c0_g1_i1.p1  ORF type:complete len:436 (+),score=163.80 TRINITY_DN15696_c0_g1_i1:31-1308(+)
MGKIRHKTDFKKSLRDAQGPLLKRPYQAPPKPEAQLFKRAEDACKELAAHDVEIRDQALADIRTMLRWLEVTENHDYDLSVEFAKLWRGLFYCMWHSDKPLVQLDCADRIADLTMTIKSWTLRTEWIAQCWACLQKEWSLIDKWRVDKYYSLMRRLYNRQLQAQIEVHKELGDTDDGDIALAAFCQPVLDLYEKGITGVASHITDIFIEECVAVEMPADDFTNLFLQFILPVLMTSSKYHCERIYDYVWMKMLGGYKESDEVVDWLAEIEWDDLLPAIEASALDEETKDENRGLLSKMAEELQTFLGQVDEHEEFVEIDDEEELHDIREAKKRDIVIQHREEADTTAKKMKETKEKRIAQRKMKKAIEKGDDKAVKGVIQNAKKHGVKLPQVKKNKKKGKGGLSKLAENPKDIQKKKSRHKKRRI